MNSYNTQRVNNNNVVRILHPSQKNKSQITGAQSVGQRSPAAYGNNIKQLGGGFLVVNGYNTQELNNNNEECIFKNADFIVAKSTDQYMGSGRLERPAASAAFGGYIRFGSGGTKLSVYTRPNINYSAVRILHPSQKNKSQITGAQNVGQGSPAHFNNINGYFHRSNTGESFLIFCVSKI